MPEALLEGGKAPDFRLPDGGGREHSLSDYRGRWLVIYFYPKDNTSACSQEAVDFSTELEAFKDLGAAVVGVSPDSVESHRRFAEKRNLAVTLLSDESRETLRAYGAWGTKKMYGREFQGVLRSTVLIDGEGTVRRIWRNVKVKGHVGAVFEALEGFRGIEGEKCGKG
ncbi:MAG: peroxiredoxin [Synergistales bacterium]|nr:peroxiredoxin [Synergistales bacterium]